MRRIRGAAAFLYDFVVGDDPLMAAAVVVALGATAVAAGADLVAWWIAPLVVMAALGYSVIRAPSG